MANPADAFKINLNQNLWGLVFGFTSLGLAEYYELCVLFWFATALSLIMLLSVLLTTFAYTKNYIKNKSQN